jgi:hypothetical protein
MIFNFSPDIPFRRRSTMAPSTPNNRKIPTLCGMKGPCLFRTSGIGSLSGLWLIGPDLNDPQDVAANANPGTLMRLLTGLEFAPILSMTSGYRANPVTGLDSNREHIYPFAARPQGYGRNSLSTSQNINLDLRVLKMVPVRNGHLDIVAESFNLLNHQNISLLNTAFGSEAAPQASFGQPIGTSTPRRIQFSLDYEF